MAEEYMVMNHMKFTGAALAGGIEGEWFREAGDEAEKAASFSENIDWSRTHLNYSLTVTKNGFGDERDAPQFRGLATQTKKSLEKMAELNAENGFKTRKTRKDAVEAVSTVFSASPEFWARHRDPETGEIDEVGRQFFKDCLEFVKDEYAGVLLAAEVHLDETTPHAHVVWMPILQEVKENPAGEQKIFRRLSAKDLLGGRKKLSKAQTDCAEQVGAKYGLARGEVRVEPDKSSFVPGAPQHNRHELPQQRRERLRREVADLEDAKAKAAGELAEAQRKSAQLQQQVAAYDEAKRKADAEEERRQSAKADKQKMRDDVQVLQDSKRVLTDEVRALRNERDELKRAVKPLEGERRELERVRGDLKAARSDAEAIRASARADAQKTLQEAASARSEAQTMLDEAREVAASVGSLWDLMVQGFQQLWQAVSDEPETSKPKRLFSRMLDFMAWDENRERFKPVLDSVFDEWTGKKSRKQAGTRPVRSTSYTALNRAVQAARDLDR